MIQIENAMYYYPLEHEYKLMSLLYTSIHRFSISNTQNTSCCNHNWTPKNFKGSIKIQSILIWTSLCKSTRLKELVYSLEIGGELTIDSLLGLVVLALKFVHPTTNKISLHKMSSSIGLSLTNTCKHRYFYWKNLHTELFNSTFNTQL